MITTVGQPVKSSFSSPNCEYSVEVTVQDVDGERLVAVRDTKDRALVPELFSPIHWAKFIHQVKSGEFQLTAGVDTYRIGALFFDRQEWEAFVQGVNAGEFDLSEELAGADGI